MIKQIKFDVQKVKLLSICCSFRRPDHLKEMIKTFYETKSEGTELFIYLHDDDPLLQQYLPIVSNQSYIIDKHRMLCKAINHVVFELFPGVRYYQTVVDDMRFRTRGWDTALISALNKNMDFGSASPRTINDKTWNEYQHPSAEVYSWKFVNVIGYVYPPDLDAFCADYYLRDISKAVGGLIYVSNVYIEHLWWGSCNKPEDINIKEAYAHDKMIHGFLTHHKWVTTEMDSLAIKLNNLKQKEIDGGQIK